MSFTEAIKNHLAVVVHAVPLNILIWGPGDADPRNYQKRLKFRETIQGRFPNCDVRFSEDPELRASIAGSSELLLHEQELWHLAACHVCIVLDTSKGAGEEIAHFSSSWHAHKLLILTHEKYRNHQSFPSSIRANKNQLFYSDLEYEQCSLTEKVIARIRQVALQLLTSYPHALP